MKMKDTISSVFDNPDLNLCNRLTGKRYYEYDPTSGRLNDGSGYTKVAFDDLQVESASKNISLKDYHDSIYS
jgi:hypothetical protein